jgi:predicted dehydrogenase
MRSTTEIGAAVIGAGFIGAAHIEALRRLNVPVRGLLGRTHDPASKRAGELGVARTYASLDELLEDPAVDVVHVASPNAAHYPQVRQILQAGRHVVCEKPLATSSAESAVLAAEARAAGVVAAVNFNLRFYPLNQHVRQLVADGGIGVPRLLSGHYLQDWLLFESDWNWRLEPEVGGELRAVADIGSHWLDLAAFLGGAPISHVLADLATFVPVRQQPTGPVQTFAGGGQGETVAREIRSEDAASILLRFAGGARGAVTVSQVSPGRKNSLRYEIDGSLGAVAWDSERPDELWLGRRDAPNEILLRNPALMNRAGTAAAFLPGGHAEGFADTFKAAFAAIYADVASGGPSASPAYATFADGHDEMLVNDAVAESARSSTWVAVAR